MTGGKFLSYIMEGTFFIPQCYHHNTLWGQRNNLRDFIFKHII